MSGAVTAGLWVSRLGAGTPLLCLHGGPGWDHHYLRPALDRLANRAELLYVDLPGSGRSAAAPPHPHGPLAAQAEALESLLCSLGTSRVVLFAHSFGGLVALEVALRYPQRVRALILVSAYAAFRDVATTFALVFQRASDEQRTVLATSFADPPETDEAMAHATRTVLPLYSVQPLDPGLDRFENIRYRSAAFAEAVREILPVADFAPRLREIGAPTLVLAGRHDWIAPPQGAAGVLSSGIPDAHLVTLEASAHLPFLEEPETFAHHVTGWLAERGLLAIPSSTAEAGA
jgi:proline iminopeptidase